MASNLMIFDEAGLREQTRRLLEWYGSMRRILPWREDPTPYHVWLSEIILQQTRVETGKAYYLRFLEAFPDIAALAAAPEEVYLKIWEGLGYYSRVHNLHKAAVIIMEEYGGSMPDTAKELEKLPGIGPYSAAAIASIAFGERVVCLDGNLMRIFSRLTEYLFDIKTQAARRAAEEYYSRRIPEERPGDFNQALMDLGAGICIPNGAPFCHACPWAEYCEGRLHASQTAFPILSARKQRKIEKRSVLLLRRGARIAIKKRPARGLLAGLYEFPNVEGHMNETALSRHLDALGLSPGEIVGSPVRLKDARHVFTHVEWQMIGYGVTLQPPTGSGSEESAQDAPVSGRQYDNNKEEFHAKGDLIWADRQELAERYSIPSAFEVYRRAAMEWLQAEGEALTYDMSGRPRS